MRIQKTHPESHREIAQSKGEAGKSDRFSMILEERRRESMSQFNLLAQSESPELPMTTGQSGQISGVPASIDIERLASEIVDRISSHQVDGSRSVDIQFNSQTLEGLRVNVRSSQGSIAVSFLTPAPRVAGLVQKDLYRLRSALESKGIRVSQLAVSTLTG